jgi:hypothetical protein
MVLFSIEPITTPIAYLCHVYFALLMRFDDTNLDNRNADVLEAANAKLKRAYTAVNDEAVSLNLRLTNRLTVH